jgi:hypothetical protein
MGRLLSARRAHHGEVRDFGATDLEEFPTQDYGVAGLAAEYLQVIAPIQSDTMDGVVLQQTVAGVGSGSWMGPR